MTDKLATTRKAIAAVVMCSGLLCASPVCAERYEVGPGRAHAAIGDVPWETLSAGDEVLIYWRAEPYCEKWVICRRGTAEQPIRVQGIPGPDGQLPVIDGRQATTRPTLNFWGEQRGVIKIGGANHPADTMPAHVVLENLEIRSGRPPFGFEGRHGRTAYAKNAASIFVEKGDAITIRHCILHDSSNGLFVSPQSRNIVVENCRIHGNGIEGSLYEHNSYTQAEGIVFQANFYGPLRRDCPGNNLKDRSAGLVVRYNWIDGGNRALDLVDAAGVPALSSQAAYRETFVYGNVLIKRDGGNNQVVHYGGDSNRPDAYRKGTLYFYNNTVVSHRQHTTTLFRLSTGDESVECHNNIVYATAGGRLLALMTQDGTLTLHRNWLPTGWRPSHSALAGAIRGAEHIVGGQTPGFADFDASDFRLLPSSPCAQAGSELPEALVTRFPVVRQYVPHQQTAPRNTALDLGAFQRVEQQP
jgi:hypothetical protein